MGIGILIYWVTQQKKILVNVRQGKAYSTYT
jgi:hypothetical protein